jgi:molybdate transport system ATP-binding protein
MSVILSDCSIQHLGNILLPSISWDSRAGTHWLITGSNGSGKSILVSALAGQLDIIPSANGIYANSAAGSIALVSFETAAALIEEERKRDDSDFIEGGVDPGRTPRVFISEALQPPQRESFISGKNLEGHPIIQALGLASVLDRGLKYLSTGEIRRTLLCRALIAQPALLILDDPYDGLDAVSRETLKTLLTTGLETTALFLVMDRIESIPPIITHVLELDDSAISFSGPREDYERLLGERDNLAQNGNLSHPDTTVLDDELARVRAQSDNALSPTSRPANDILVEMTGVTVEWSGRKVLDNLTWTLRRGEHWLIRGPNGSGKTTFLELITGDNPQVFRNDVRLFGVRRGSGETIWELKEKMGIVSYRLHTEYRNLGDLPLETIVISGLHDSIGLYQQCGDEEREIAKKWLALTGFAGREHVLFRDLSYGEQRAILIARASVKQPPLLILDEPCHGLDATQRARVLAILQTIAAAGRSTILHVTHDPSEALPCERHILELRPGESPMYGTITI